MDPNEGIGRGGAISADGDDRCVVPAAMVGVDGVPGRVLIAPWGEVESANGRFVVDEQSAREVTAAFAAHGTDVPIDYEHQSLGGAYASPSGQAPAAGWIRALRAVPPEEVNDGAPGLYAEVEWTIAAREKLAAKEYRYLSPVVIVRKNDRRVVALHSAALTNKPAIPGMRPIVNRAEASLTGLRVQLGLAADSQIETVLVAAEERISSLTREAAEREAGERIQAAMRSGRLVPAQREWALSLAMNDPAGFDAWLKTAPPIVVPGRTEPPISRAGSGRDREAIATSARAAFRSDPNLALLTSEEAWVQESLREVLGENSRSIG